MAKNRELKDKLANLLNVESREADSNTPDFILGEFLDACLGAFEVASNKREVWYGVTLDILNDWQSLIKQALSEASMCWSETPKGTFDSDKVAEIGKKLFNDIKMGPDLL